MKEQYTEFMKALNFTRRDCELYCWANVMRPGQHIARHNHGTFPYSYLSGNMQYAEYDTIVRYYNPFSNADYSFSNEKGTLTFFPSYIYHDSDIFTGPGVRVSSGFDIFDKQMMSEPGNACGLDIHRIDF